MQTISLFVVLVIGVSSGSALSLIPTQCLPYPCAPPPPDWVYPWCKHQCTVNTDCGVGGLCCPGCGCRVCQQRTPIDSCKTKTCPAGEVCIDTPVLCKKPPCPQTRCVPISTKPGNCPQFRCPIPINPTPCSDKCKTDDDCKGDLKCCTDCTGCRTCLAPWGLPLSGCDNMQCPGGEVCVPDPQPHCACKKRQVFCFASPCMFSRCDNHPGATCSDNYCGGCHAVWRLNGNILTDCSSAGPLEQATDA